MELTFDIQLAQHNVNSRILCNGQDISGAIRAVHYTQVAGELPKVTLELIAPRVRITADQGPPPNDITPNGQIPPIDGRNWT